LGLLARRFRSSSSWSVELVVLELEPLLVEEAVAGKWMDGDVSS
jgi:hypothetical protein